DSRSTGSCVVHQSEAGDQRLAFVIECMRRPAQDPVERESIDGQRALFAQESRDALLAEMQDFRIDECLRLLESTAQDVGALVELEVGAGPGVLGELFPRKHGEAVIALGHVRLEIEALPEARGAVAEMALATC